MGIFSEEQLEHMAYLEDLSVTDSDSTHAQPSSLWSHGPAGTGMPMESDKTKKAREIRAGLGLSILTVLIIIALCLIFIPGGIL